jgi:hypothetical protein
MLRFVLRGRWGDRLAWLWLVAGRAEVLDGPGDLLMEMLGSVDWPVGIAEKFAGEENNVGLTVADNLIGLLGRGDHTN